MENTNLRRQASEHFTIELEEITSK